MTNEHSKKQTILVTGCAGFIGSKITELLLEHGDTACLCDARRQVVGVDNLNNAYAPSHATSRFSVQRGDQI